MPNAHSDSSKAILANPAPEAQNRPKLEGGIAFQMESEFTPAGDQPVAIKE